MGNGCDASCFISARLLAGGVLPLSVLWVACSSMQAQNGTQPSSPPPKSLAEMATQAKTKKTDHARVVLDDENGADKTPIIPNVWEDDCDNTDAILTAIIDYRRTHTRNETEELMHAWYDKHAERLEHAAEENRRIQRGREEHYEYPYDYGEMKPGDYQQYYEEQRAASRSAYDDQWRYNENYQLIYHTETVFQKVKYGVRRIGMDFDWFKLRCGINFCTY